MQEDPTCRNEPITCLPGKKDQGSRGAIRSGFMALATVLIIFFVYLGASFATVHRPPSDLRSTIAKAFASGDLTYEDRLRFDAVRGDHQYNDCLILTMSILRSGNAIEDAVSPLMCVKPETAATPATICGMLGEATGDVADAGCPQQRYHRYLHGHRILAALLVPSLGIAEVRVLLRACAYLLLAGLAIGALMPQSQLKVDRRSALAITAGFAAFFGLNYFGTSLSHGPADLVLLAFLATAATTSLLDMGRNAYVVIVAGFAALTAIFEFLTGGLPLSLAILIGMIGLQANSTHTARQVAARSISGVVVFLACFGLTFALKLAFAWAVFGNTILNDFQRALAGRVSSQLSSGQAATLLDLVNAVRWNLGEITWGSEVAGYGLVALSASAAVIGLVRVYRNRDVAAVLTRAVLVILSGLVVPLWYAIFMNHTIEHAWFMVRIAVWPLICGWLLALAPGVQAQHMKCLTTREAA
ncbi:MAG: hypothetical protein KA760_07935 [Steroidobacteraceae bacterium]|nr:hypothetical protein [Steroidobacteraceae bacterium]